jgi:cullin-associated NEDD8-dissociated protein 1
VKCLGPLVNKVKDVQVDTIVDTLCSNMLSEKEQLRDISSIGLKTVISELAPTSTALAASICKKITGRLTSAVTKQEDVSVQLEALDILSDLLARFGSLLVSFHQNIQQALLPQLSSARLAVRKRSIIAIGHLVMSCNNSVFIELVEFLLSELSKNANISTTRTYIQCLGSITRQAGHRIGEHLEKIIPLIVKFSRVDDDELREYCIQAFESFVRRCPKHVSPHIPVIIKICLEYIVYDPNYNYDDDDEESDSMETEDDDDEAGGTDDEYSDDDDMSWKVRRASAKCLAAIIATRHEMLREFYSDVSPTLINRFKEREENVKTDIFFAYITLLKQTKPSILQDVDSMEHEEGPVTQLQSQVPNIVKALYKLLKEKSIKTRQGCFSLLSELVQVLPGALSDHIAAIIPGIQFSLSDKNSSSNMKIDTLTFINLLLTHHMPSVFHPHLDAIVTPVVSAVGDPFYKITSEALLVCQQLVKVIRPLDVKIDYDYVPYMASIYQCTLVRLRATDIDQEVKERAIACMGQIICNMGDGLGPELGICLPIFLDRLKNEITRLTAVKAVTMIAGSPLHINLSPILSECIPVLSSFLRKNHRALRLCTL